MTSGPLPLLQRCGVVLAVVALFSIAGGHWALLQTVAWAKMLQDYSKDSTVAAAVEKTFSGEAPCKMCLRIADGKKKEEERQAPATVKVDKKAETFVASGRQMAQMPPGVDFSYAFPNDAAALARFDAPPVPVPIARPRLHCA